MARNADEFIGTAQAAAVLGVTTQQVRNLIRQGVLTGKKLGRDFLIRRGDLASVPRVRKPGPKPKASQRVVMVQHPVLRRVGTPDLPARPRRNDRCNRSPTS